MTNILEFYHKILNTLNTSGVEDIVFLDFKKAFHKVPHRRLMSKVIGPLTLARNCQMGRKLVGRQAVESRS